MTNPGPLSRFRLIDGVIVAAVALLGLKVLGFFAVQFDASGSPPPEDDLPAFGRVLSHARTNYQPAAAQALADPISTGSVGPKKEEPPAKEPDPPKRSEPAPSLLPASPSEQALSARLGERRDELQQRARDVELREKLIDEQEKKLEQRLGDEKAREDQERAAASKGGSPEGAALKGLVTMYEAMKPKDAARVFDRLPLDTLLSVVTQMNPRKMSEVLAAMTPETAEKLTVALATKGKAESGARTAEANAGLPSGELPAIALPAAPRR